MIDEDRRGPYATAAPFGNELRMLHLAASYQDAAEDITRVKMWFADGIMPRLRELAEQGKHHHTLTLNEHIRRGVQSVPIFMIVKVLNLEGLDVVVGDYVGDDRAPTLRISWGPL